MFYNYVELNDGTQIAYSNFLEDGTVQIGIERSTEDGFDSARCLLPAFSWSEVDGFSQDEVDKLQHFLRNNLPLIWRLAGEVSREYA